jgi:DNA primase
MFPIIDYRGRIIGFGGRIIDQGEPKYLNSPETPLFQKGHELYGLYQAIKANHQLNRVMIVEGYMDVIALFQHGVTYAVATLGTATTHHHLQRLFRYTADIIFCFDGDAAGRTAAWRALQVVLPIMHDSLQIRFLFLPDGEDPDTLIRKEGQVSFEKRIEHALPLSAFFFHTLSRQSDMNTMEGRARFAAAALQHIKQLPLGLFQEILLEELSKRARIDIHSLKQQLKSQETAPQSTHLQAVPQPSTTKLPASMRLAIALLLQYPALAASIQEPLPQSALPGHTFLTQLLEITQKSPHITPGMLIEYWRGQKEEALIAALAHWEHMVPENGIKSEFLGAIRQLTLLSYDEEINRLLAKANQDALSEAEKLELANWISKKKTLIQ